MSETTTAAPAQKRGAPDHNPEVTQTGQLRRMPPC